MGVVPATPTVAGTVGMVSAVVSTEGGRGGVVGGDWTT